MNAAYVYVVFCVATIAAGQLIFKYVGNRLSEVSLAGLVEHPGVLSVFAAGVALYGVSTVLWVLALRDLPLGRAYLFMALAFVLVPLGAWAIFGEALTPRYVAGALLVAVGIAISVS